MAEGFLRVYGAHVVEPASAGMEPKALNPHAVAVMAEKGVDISLQTSKPFSEPLARAIDYVITVCGDAEARCPVLPPSPLGPPLALAAPRPSPSGGKRGARAGGVQAVAGRDRAAGA